MEEWNISRDQILEEGRESALISPTDDDGDGGSD